DRLRGVLRLWVPAFAGTSGRGVPDCPPRCCREFALERAKSLGLLGKGRPSGVIKGSQNQVVGRGWLLPSRPRWPACGALIAYSSDAASAGGAFAAVTPSRRRRRAGRTPDGERGRGRLPMGGRGQGKDRRLAVRASRYRRALPGWAQ